MLASCLRFLGSGGVKGRRAGGLRVVVVVVEGVHGKMVGILLLDAFLLSLKCKLQIYVY